MVLQHVRAHDVAGLEGWHKRVNNGVHNRKNLWRITHIHKLMSARKQFWNHGIVCWRPPSRCNEQFKSAELKPDLVGGENPRIVKEGECVDGGHLQRQVWLWWVLHHVREYAKNSLYHKTV